MMFVFQSRCRDSFSCDGSSPASFSVAIVVSVPLPGFI